jgi:diketogulonate reductase-like aldo/keto reductase
MEPVAAGAARIPRLGFGTWELRGRHAQAMVETALELGYRHLDTAQMYGNEAEVGAAIRAVGLPRAEIFVTTKVWPDRFRAGDLERSAEESLARLGLDAIDLLLLHWPNPNVPLAETLAALERVAARGIARHLGVSNFTVALLDEALALAARPLVCNQVEYHARLDQSALLARVRGVGMALTAYCPLARGKLVLDPVLQRIGARHRKSAGQVALRWLVQQDGVVAIPRSGKPEHARANFAIFDFALSAEEMAEIDRLAQGRGRVVDLPGLAPDWD